MTEEAEDESTENETEKVKTDNTIPDEVHEKAEKIAKALLETKPKPLKDYRVN